MSDLAKKTPILLECRNLSFSYDGNEDTLKNVNLFLKERDFLAIIGPNGGGKTTLVKILLGLLKAKKGNIYYPNLKILNPKSLIGYVPQDTNLNSDFPIQAIDVVKMGFLKKELFGHTFSKKESKKQETQNALKFLDKLGIAHLAYRRISELSGGQRQRVLIARAICGEPKLLILDEPTSSIDTKTQTEIYKILKNFNAFYTIIVISHNLSILLEHASKILYVNKEIVTHEVSGLALDTNGHMSEVSLLDKFVLSGEKNAK